MIAAGSRRPPPAARRLRGALGQIRRRARARGAAAPSPITSKSGTPRPRSRYCWAVRAARGGPLPPLPGWNGLTRGWVAAPVGVVVPLPDVLDVPLAELELDCEAGPLVELVEPELGTVLEPELEALPEPGWEPDDVPAPDCDAAPPPRMMLSISSGVTGLSTGRLEAVAERLMASWVSDTLANKMPRPRCVRTVWLDCRSGPAPPPRQRSWINSGAGGVRSPACLRVARLQVIQLVPGLDLVVQYLLVSFR